MLTDIEKLIERLRAKRRDMTCDDYDAILGEAADALTRLVAPLPAEVEASIAYLAGKPGCICGNCTAARLLEWQARENANLNALLDEARSTRDDSLQLAKDAFESLAREVDYLQGRHQQAVDEGLAVCVERDRLAAENAEHVMYRAALATEAKETGDENDRLRAELASYKAATKLVVEYDGQQDKLDAKKGGV